MADKGFWEKPVVHKVTFLVYIAVLILAIWFFTLSDLDLFAIALILDLAIVTFRKRGADQNRDILYVTYCAALAVSYFFVMNYLVYSTSFVECCCFGCKWFVFLIPVGGPIPASILLFLAYLLVKRYYTGEGGEFHKVKVDEGTLKGIKFFSKLGLGYVAAQALGVLLLLASLFSLYLGNSSFDYYKAALFFFLFPLGLYCYVLGLSWKNNKKRIKV